MRSHRFVVIVVASLMALVVGAAATRVAEAADDYRDVTPAELQALLASDDPFVVDVHVPTAAHLAETDARIPYTEIAARVDEFPADRDAVVVVYCMSGRMSEIAAHELANPGYRNVLNLAGGMQAWQAAGYELLLN